jgi:hypothetical protein
MTDLFPNKRWLVIPTTITGSIEWNQVQGDVAGLRLSVDQTQTFVKYDITEITASYTQSYIQADTGEIKKHIVEAGIYGRPSIYSSEYSEYKYQPMVDLLSTPEWTPSGSVNDENI